MTVKCPRSVYTIILHRSFHFGTKCASLAFDRKIENGRNNVCKIPPEPNCTSNTNYTENVIEVQNTQNVLKVSKIKKNTFTYDLC